MLFNRVTLIVLLAIILCLSAFCLLVDLVRLSVPVQVTGWKDPSMK